MLTSISNKQVVATGVRFENNMVYILLDDGREIGLAMDKLSWLRWLYDATPEQRDGWSIEPGGFAVYWEDDALDNGIEIEHILGMEPVTQGWIPS